MLLWQSLDTWLITFISIAYLSLLFGVAYWGQKHSKWVNNPWVYSLSLGVSCTSWAFYGTVGQAAVTGAWLAPIYIGSILCLVIAWPMLMRILAIIKKQNLTSIADFIACRYDRSPKIAGMVALVALVGTIPYIALQLRAISTSFDLLTGTFEIGISTAFIVTLVLIFFSILFGTRHISVSKQNPGLVLAIALVQSSRSSPLVPSVYLLPTLSLMALTTYLHTKPHCQKRRHPTQFTCQCHKPFLALSLFLFCHSNFI